MNIRIDVFEGPILLGNIDYDWADAQSIDTFIAQVVAQYPNYSRFEIHYDLS
jgi:hypothetical protein